MRQFIVGLALSLIFQPAAAVSQVGEHFPAFLDPGRPPTPGVWRFSVGAGVQSTELTTFQIYESGFLFASRFDQRILMGRVPVELSFGLTNRITIGALLPFAAFLAKEERGPIYCGRTGCTEPHWAHVPLASMGDAELRGTVAVVRRDRLHLTPSLSFRLPTSLRRLRVVGYRSFLPGDGQPDLVFGIGGTFRPLEFLSLNASVSYTWQLPGAPARDVHAPSFGFQNGQTVFRQWVPFPVDADRDPADYFAGRFAVEMAIQRFRLQGHLIGFQKPVDWYEDPYRSAVDRVTGIAYPERTQRHNAAIGVSVVYVRPASELGFEGLAPISGYNFYGGHRGHGAIRAYTRFYLGRER